MNKYYKYQTFWRRFFALIIDGVILSIISRLFEVIPEVSSVFISTILTIIDSGLPYIYAILMIGKFGQTLGKMVMGVKIVDNSTEGRASYYQAFTREVVPLFLVTISIIFIAILFSGEDLENFKLSTLGYIIVFLPSSMLLLWSILEVVTMLFNEKYRALHDIIANTVVVKVQKNE